MPQLLFLPLFTFGFIVESIKELGGASYLEYVKDFDLNAHVNVFKVSIRTNSETNDANIVDLFCFTLKNIIFD